MSKPIAVIRTVLFLMALGCCLKPSTARPPDGMVEAMLHGRKVEGMVLGGGGMELNLLGRDGRLWRLGPDDVQRLRRVSTRFRPLSISEFRAALLRELGKDYEVSGTGHYLVAHPRGQRDRWAKRFEDLYRSFVRYFSVRGCRPTTPPFPLVGIVWKSREDFARHASPGSNAPRNIAGFYDVGSNRIHIYDMGGGADSAFWRQNAAVLIHEATHQTAFNTGIHSRFALQPTWLLEGLATLFEAPGVHDSANYPDLDDRVNRRQLDAFRHTVPSQRRAKSLADLIASDQIFRTNPAAAYAESWALTFFLMETEPHKYVEYLKRMASRPAFQAYTPRQRTADFTAIFGGNWQMLDARLSRFIDGL